MDPRRAKKFDMSTDARKHRFLRMWKIVRHPYFVHIYFPATKMATLQIIAAIQTRLRKGALLARYRMP